MPELVDAIETAAGLDSVVAMPTGEALAALIAAVGAEGDPAHGEEVYRRSELACIACHAIGGAGGLVGPDLLSLGASAPLDYIIQAVLDPQASIKEGYEVTTVTLTDGSLVAGILLRESEAELLLRDAANGENRIPTSQVASRERTSTSLMPPGLTASLREDELLDLLALLSALGRSVTVPAERYVRRYDLLEAGQMLNQVLDGRGLSWAAATPNSEGLPWHRVYARVDGSLPTGVASNGSSAISSDGSQYRVVRFDLDVQRAGAVGLEVNDPLGLIFYANGARIPSVQKVTTLELPAGRQTVTVMIYLRDYASSANNRPSDMPLRIRLVDLPGSAAQVQAVNADRGQPGRLDWTGRVTGPHGLRPEKGDAWARHAARMRSCRSSSVRSASSHRRHRARRSRRSSGS